MAERFVVDQRLVVAGRQHVARPRFESHRPVERFDRMASPRVRMQVVNEIAAAHHQHAFVAQRRETRSGVVMKSRRLRVIDAELHNRNVGVWKKMTEN